jgi:hypothetical protein
MTCTLSLSDRLYIRNTLHYLMQSKIKKEENNK